MHVNLTTLNSNIMCAEIILFRLRPFLNTLNFSSERQTGNNKSLKQ